jgi:molybdopterin synthase sulfur carrier subunit
MKITVKLFASLARYSAGGLPGTPFEVILPASTQLEQLVAQLGIPADETKVAFVNGLVREMDCVLQPGDKVGIFPPIGGG